MRRLLSCYFALGRDNKYPRLAKVLEHTARKHCPGWHIRIDRIHAAETEQTPPMSGRRGLSTNTDKLRWWVDRACELPDGDEVALLDADTMILRPLDSVWELDFDFAYTKKANVLRLPLNGGVVFLRVNDRSRAFLRRWLEVNDHFWNHPNEEPCHEPWRLIYAGINQAALGYMLTTGNHPPLAILELPCRVWNACHDDPWRSALTEARIVHIKSALRRSVFHPRRRDAALMPLVQRWIAEEHEALHRGAAAPRTIETQ